MNLSKDIGKTLVNGAKYVLAKPLAVLRYAGFIVKWGLLIMFVGAIYNFSTSDYMFDGAFLDYNVNTGRVSIGKVDSTKKTKVQKAPKNFVGLGIDYGGNPQLSYDRRLLNLLGTSLYGGFYITQDPKSKLPWVGAKITIGF